MPQVQTPSMASATGPPADIDIDRFMAIVMPVAGQLPCDPDLMALQLKAAAELAEIYED